MRRLLVALVAAALPAHAQESAPKTEANQELPAVGDLSCEAAVTRALAAGPALGALDAAHARARAESVESWPGLELRARSGFPGPIEATRAGVRVELPRPGERGAEADALRAGGDEALAEARAAEVELAHTTRVAHLAVRRARLAVAWADEDHRHRLARLAALRQQVSAGLENTVTLAREAMAVDDLADDTIDARAELAAAEADLARLAWGSASDAPCTPTLAEAADAHPEVQAARAGVLRVASEGEARQRSSGFWPRMLDVEWDQLDATAGRVLVSVGIALPSFADEAAEAETGDAAARARLAAAEATVTAEVRRLQAHLAAADARIAALDARAAPPELSVLADARRLRTLVMDALALEAMATRRDRRRVEARLAREALVIELARALGRP